MTIALKLMWCVFLYFHVLYSIFKLLDFGITFYCIIIPIFFVCFILLLACESLHVLSVVLSDSRILMLTDEGIVGSSSMKEDASQVDKIM